MTALTLDALVKAMARGMRRDAENGRDDWHRDDGINDAWRSSARAALAALAAVAFRDPQELLVQASYATPPVAALLRALAEAADKRGTHG